MRTGYMRKLSLLIGASALVAACSGTSTEPTGAPASSSSVTAPEPTYSSLGPEAVVDLGYATCSITRSSLACTSTAPFQAAVDDQAPVTRQIVAVGEVAAGQHLSTRPVAPIEAEPGTLLFIGPSQSPAAVLSRKDAGGQWYALPTGEVKRVQDLGSEGVAMWYGAWSGATKDLSVLSTELGLPDRLGADGSLTLNILVGKTPHKVVLSPAKSE